MARGKSDKEILIERAFIEKEILNTLGITLVEQGDDEYSAYARDIIDIRGGDYFIKGLDKFCSSIGKLAIVQEKSTKRPGDYYNNEVCQNLIKVDKEIVVSYKGYEETIYKYHHFEKVMKDKPDALRGGIFQPVLADIRLSGTILSVNKAADGKQGIIWFGDERKLKEKALEVLKDNFDDVINYLTNDIASGVVKVSGAMVMVDKQGEKMTLNIMLPRKSNLTLFCIVCKPLCPSYKEFSRTTHISERVLKTFRKFGFENGFQIVHVPVGMRVFKPKGYGIIAEEDYNNADISLK